jgi:hypothetical protein
VTRETVAINVGSGANDAARPSVPPQSPYWDLDLLTPDDVCTLLKVKKAGSTTPLRAVSSRLSD